ncbi:hypothetical protein DL98DRAFT_607324 [Cadophora sp. DSE1049]|nr:hypothetical protein DL98DRAFT_607324 [Cadophora sp. DSE1049]
MPITRTVTHGDGSLALPGPREATFSFFENEGSVVKITVPNVSKWVMKYHWHDRAALCEKMEFLPGGDVEFYRSLGVYRNSTEVGKWGMTWQNRPGERCTWFIDTHHDRPADSPELVVLIRSPGNEEMWRNAISATLDQELWPQLNSTPVLLRLWIRMVKKIPFVGGRLWRCIIRCVLWLQLLLIYQRHEYWMWCGEIWICRFFHVPGEMAPKWAQDLEWESAQILTRLSMRVARVLRPFLGLEDGYPEYYAPSGTAIVKQPLEDTHGIAEGYIVAG